MEHLKTVDQLGKWLMINRVDLSIKLIKGNWRIKFSKGKKIITKTIAVSGNFPEPYSFLKILDQALIEYEKVIGIEYDIDGIRKS